MKKTVAFFIILILAACGSKGGDGDVITINTLQKEKGKKIQIKVYKGKHWEQPFKFKNFSGKTIPQIAIWAEDEKGSFLQTLMVTKSFGKQTWRMAKDQKPDKPFRPRSIPYWMFKRHEAGRGFPTKNKPVADTVSAASPRKSFQVNTILSDVQGKVNILLEFNNSFDMNKDHKTFNGQPALVYQVNADLSKKGTYTMKLIGHSSPTGKDGKLYSVKKGFTTALSIIKKAEVIVK